MISFDSLEEIPRVGDIEMSPLFQQRTTDEKSLFSPPHRLDTFVIMEPEPQQSSPMEEDDCPTLQLPEPPPEKKTKPKEKSLSLRKFHQTYGDTEFLSPQITTPILQQEMNSHDPRIMQSIAKEKDKIRFGKLYLKLYPIAQALQLKGILPWSSNAESFEENPSLLPKHTEWLLRGVLAAYQVKEKKPEEVFQELFPDTEEIPVDFRFFFNTVISSTAFPFVTNRAEE